MNTEKPIIRLVDDDISVLYSTQLILEEYGWSVKTYSSPIDFLNHDNLNVPGCVVLDVRMPQMTGLEVQEKIIERGFDYFPIIFLSGHGDIQMAVRTLTKGAVTFLEKPTEPEKLNEEISRAVKLGQAKAIEVEQKRELFRKYRSLTPREKEVLKLVASGLTNQEIADHLQVALATIKMHRSNATDKLELRSAAEITRALLLLNEVNGV